MINDKPTNARLLWSQAMSNGLRGAVLARERGCLLAWDEKNWLYLLTLSGHPEAQRRLAGNLAVVCCADDGSAYAAGGDRGQIWWLNPDLMQRWEKLVPKRPLAIAMDAFGQHLAVSDAANNLHIFNRQGETLCHIQCPRPLHHLSFIPTVPFLIGCADFGLVACFDLGGRWVWRDGLVAHIGSMAVNGDGERILLSCFSEGLQGYSLTGRNLGRVAVPEPCRLTALSFDGRLALTTGVENRILLLDADGRVLSTHALSHPILSLALTPLGDTAILALAKGPLVGLKLRPA